MFIVIVESVEYRQILSDEVPGVGQSGVHDLGVHDLILKVWIQARLLSVELGLLLWVATTPVTNISHVNPKAVEQFADSTSLQL